jgi:membrane protease YdiL (CAAX protease family)
MFAAVVGIGVLTGAFVFEGIADNINWGLIALIFWGFFLQGMEEEILCRGWMMTSVARKSSVLAGVITSSVVFSLLHIFNPGIAILPIINLTLFGLFASIYMLRTDNIWGVSAIHSIWNFTQGSLFGLSVSGMDSMPTILKFSSTENTLLNGGAFGPEGGLIVSIVLIISIVIACLVKSIKDRQIN